eukprot:jgi/Bigna1/142517/aug1.70_g17225
MLFSSEIPEDLRSMEWNLVRRDPPSKVLLVAFAGGGVRLGGIALPEWRKTCSRVEEVDYLTVVDVHQKWYLHGYQRWRERFSKIFERYEKVLLVGSCMGASGALLFADMADGVLAYAPQTCLVNARGKYWLNSFRLPRETRINFNKLIRDRIGRCPYVYVGYSPLKDVYFSRHLPQEVVHIETECYLDNVPKWLKKTGKLIPTVRKVVDTIKLLPRRKQSLSDEKNAGQTEGRAESVQ